MFCSKCGKNNPDGAAFCSGCGSPMHQAQQTTQQTTQQVPPQVMPQYAMPVAKAGASGVKIFLVTLITLIIVGLAGGALYYFVLRDDDSDHKNDGKSTTAVSDVVDDDEDEDDDVNADVDIDEDEDEDADEGPSNSAVEVLPPSSSNDDDDDDDSASDEEKAVDTIKDAVEELHSYSSWNEESVMDYVMNYGSESYSYRVEVLSSIYDYDSDDLDSLRIDGSALIEGAGISQEWTYTYEDGVATYDYTDPSIPTQSQSIDPDLFNIDSLDDDMIKNVKIKGDKITFVIDSKAAKNRFDLLNSTLDIAQGIDDIKYSDISVKCYINDDNDTLESYHMEFTANFTMQGMDISADYVVDYNFSVID